MRSYGHWCAIATGLDAVGDRWTLLIVRELLAHGASRYTDLMDGLPGIATNLLADRLRQLEASGIVVRERGRRPVPVTLFRLTPRGEALRPILRELARWGAPALPETTTRLPYQPHWLTFLAEANLTDRKPDRGRATIEVRAGDEPFTIEVDGTIRAQPGAARRPGAVVAGSRLGIVGWLSGRLSLADAQAQGLTIEGDPKLVRRVGP